MNTIIERITEAIKEILIGMIQNGLEGMFVEVNDKVGILNCNASPGCWQMTAIPYLIILRR